MAEQRTFELFSRVTKWGNNPNFRRELQYGIHKLGDLRIFYIYRRTDPDENPPEHLKGWDRALFAHPRVYHQEYTVEDDPDYKLDILEEVLMRIIDDSTFRESSC